MAVVATAGHVDHGKSTLVRALTGIDPDRLQEERSRGLTIDLGFASTTLPSGIELELIDVPGHIRFLRNMLAGVGAVERCLFVVSAPEGWMPQSEEHLHILETLGVRSGVIALTKVEGVDPDVVQLAGLDVEDRVEGTFLQGSEIIEVDGISGAGLDDLRAGLDRMLVGMSPPQDLGRPRMWIDRSFSIAGSGAVVTGTLTSGALRVDDEVVIEPGGRRCRVRRLQTQGRHVDEIGPGHRVAANLVGVSHHDVTRGDALIQRDRWHMTTVVDASLNVLDSLGHAVSRRGAYLAYLGSGEHPARLRMLGPSAIEPGNSGFIRLHLETPVPLIPGDRFVLRESGRSETVGGGEILDVDPVVPAARARPDRSVERVVRERGWVLAEQLERLTGVSSTATVGRWVVDPTELASVSAALRARLADGPVPVAELDERTRAVLGTLSDTVVDGTTVRSSHEQAPALDSHPWLTALRVGGCSPPGPEGVDRVEIRELIRAGLVVGINGVFFAADTIADASVSVAGYLLDHPEGLTASAARDLWGNSRKHAIPLLTHLDAIGVTRRRGDVRTPGPRLPDPA